MLNSICEICGGCPYRNIDEKTYQQHKMENFMQNMARVSADVKIDEAVFISDGLRRRAEIEFSFVKNKLIMGFNESKSHNLVDISQCPMLLSEINQLLPLLHEFMTMFCSTPLKIKSKKKKVEIKYIKEGRIYVLAADNGLDIVLNLTEEPELEHRLLVADFVNKIPEICRFSWKIKENEAETIVMQRAPEIYIAGCSIEVPQNVFLQASKTAEKTMIERVVEYLGNTRGKIADLFCGLGTFTYPLAKMEGNEIVSADSYEPSLVGLKKALNRNQIQNVKIVKRNLFKYPFDKDDLKDIRAIVIDPPRAGAHEQCRAIADIPNEYKPEKIIFVSCNPNTFVYDADILIKAGYKIERVTLIDQFVYSKHQELIALFCINSK